MNDFYQLDSISFCLLLILRGVELLLLLWYLKEIPIKVSPGVGAAVLAVGLACYTAIYEMREIPVSLLHTLITNGLHLLLWGVIIFILYRLDISQIITFDLLFFILTRSVRWIFVSGWRMTRTYPYGNGLYDNSYSYIWLANLFAIILLVMAARKRIPAMKISSDKRSNLVLVVLTLFFIYIRFNLDYRSSENVTTFQIVTLSAIYLFMIALVFIIEELAISNKMQFEKEKLQLINEAKYKMLATHLEANDSVQRIYHDINRHLSCIRAVANDNQKILDYIRSINDELAVVSKVVHTGNPFLDGILSERAQLAAQNDIRLILDADLREIDFLEPIDLCAIFGNAIDNAYEAVVQIQDTSKREIHLKAKKMDGFFTIKISNYYEKAPEISGDKIITSKKDKSAHGIGLSSLKHAVKKYHGTVQIQLIDPQIFLLKVLIPIP